MHSQEITVSSVIFSDGIFFQKEDGAPTVGYFFAALER
jgi:hypothetical protein